MTWRWALLMGGLTVLAGCRQPLEQPSRSVTVIVEGGGVFPPSLAGRWQADQHGWEFVVEPDGRISAAVISLGRVRVVPGRTTTVPTTSGGQAVFTPGDWTIHYIPATRELTVKIAMAHVRVEMGGNIVEGSSTDVFEGPVAPAGDTWQVQWTMFTKYAGRTPGGASRDLSTDPVYGETKSLTFTRVVAPPR